MYFLCKRASRYKLAASADVQPRGDVWDLGACGSPVWSVNISIFRLSGQFKGFSGIPRPTHAFWLL